MKKINQELLNKLRAKLQLGQAQLYKRIVRVTSETGLDRYYASILLAMRNGINVNKYVDPEDLAVIRGTFTPRSSQIPVSPSAPIKRIIKSIEPVSLDLSFISNNDLRDILQKDLAEMNVARSQGLEKTAKTCMVLSGCIAEALLLDCLQQNQPAAQAHALTMHPRPATNIQDWTLAQMVTVAVAIGLLGNDTTSGANQLRLWRNLIHPARALKEATNNRITPTAGRARSAISFLQLVVEELGR
jgi:hypothetical protein